MLPPSSQNQSELATQSPQKQILPQWYYLKSWKFYTQGSEKDCIYCSQCAQWFPDGHLPCWQAALTGLFFF